MNPVCVRTETSAVFVGVVVSGGEKGEYRRPFLTYVGQEEVQSAEV